jgi:hypothetical protein
MQVKVSSEHIHTVSKHPGQRFPLVYVYIREEYVQLTIRVPMFVVDFDGSNCEVHVLQDVYYSSWLKMQMLVERYQLTATKERHCQLASTQRGLSTRISTIAVTMTGKQS